MVVGVARFRKDLIEEATPRRVRRDKLEFPRKLEGKRASQEEGEAYAKPYWHKKRS